MQTIAIWRNAALMLLFTTIATAMFTKDMRTMEILGLFACGAGFGASLTSMVSAYRRKLRIY